MELMVRDFVTLNSYNKPIKEIPYGVKMIGAELEWEETNKGEGIDVAVLDTGVPKHSDINNIIENEVFSDKQNTINEFDNHGHQTHVAGTICANGAIKGVAPHINLYNVKVLNDKGFGSDDSISNGILWCIDRQVDVINLSLGGKTTMPKTHEAIKKAVERDIIVVAAAGNEGNQGMGYPAIYKEVIAVSAVNIEKERPNFSSIGNEIEVASAGYKVLSTWLNNTYNYSQGTSMACPHIAGAVALLQAKAMIRYLRKLNLHEIRLLLHMFSEDIGEFGRDIHHGFGVFSFGKFR